MKTLSLSILYAFLSLPVLAGQVNAPHPGFVAYPGAPVQTVYGIPGNLLLAPSRFPRADAASFSDVAGLLAGAGRLQLLKADGAPLASTSFTGSTPVLGVSPRPDNAIAWLPGVQSILWWNGRTFTTVPVSAIDPTDVVSWIACQDSQTARLMVVHSGVAVSSVTVSLATGNLISSDSLPGVQGAAFQFGRYTVSSDAQGLQLEAAQGARHTLPFPGGFFTAEQMSAHWVHLFVPATGTHWALQIDNDEPTLSRLPALAAEKELAR